MSDPSALVSLLERELRKVEERLERSAASGDEEGDSLTEDSLLDDLDGLVRGQEDLVSSHLSALQRFLSWVLDCVREAGPREAAYFWLGASCSFLRAQPRVANDLASIEAQMRAALPYYQDLEEARGSFDRGDERRRDEPWDASRGFLESRSMRASWILQEALDLLEEQERSFRLLEE